MKKTILKTLMIVCLIGAMSANSFAMKEVKEIEDLDDNKILNTIIENPTILNSNSEEIIDLTDQELLEDTDPFNTMATDRDLWNKSYGNTYNIKKRIIATNYSYPRNNPGTVYVRITNTGNSPITANIYKGTRESQTITYGTIGVKQGRQFIVGKQYGSSDCHGNNCFAKQDFTVSLYNVNNKISFNAHAFIKY